MAMTIEELRASLESNPQPRVYVQLADLLKQEEKIEEAIETLTQCVSSFPRYLSARIALARLHFRTGAISQTLEQCEEILRADPENLVGMKLAAEAYRSREDHVEAIKHFKRLRAINPGDPDVEEAIIDLENAIEQKLTPGERKIANLKRYLASFQRRRR